MTLNSCLVPYFPEVQFSQNMIKFLGNNHNKIIEHPHNTVIEENFFLRIWNIVTFAKTRFLQDLTDIVWDLFKICPT